MKTFRYSQISLLVAALALLSSLGSCRKDLLNQLPTTKLAATEFWQTEDDATTALMGAYNEARYVFDREYYLDGHGEYTRTRGVSHSSSASALPTTNSYYGPSGYGDKFDSYFEGLYGLVSRTNYVIENVSKMLPAASATSLPSLEAIIGEARLLRGVAYFRLISMWGDVPIINKVPTDISDADAVIRAPISVVKDSILADFNYAIAKLPASPPAVGRAAKPAALSFRGKLNLYWGSWNKYGWPELEGFVPSASEAATAFQAANDDFKTVVNDFGLTLFRNGEPGNIDVLGKADVLPNYYYLFTPDANGDKEMIMTVTHGGIGTNQGEELVRDFGSRANEFAQGWMLPRYEIADRYQLTTTGDFATPLKPSSNRTLANGALNPSSYLNRDYRMKSSIQWDGELCVGTYAYKVTGWVMFQYKTSSGTVPGTNIAYNNAASTNSGYIFRKFVRNTAGLGRSEGNYNWPIMRLADVYLMYAEANNEITNGAPDPLAVEVVNKVRYRGNLPPLASAKTTGYQNFFNAIEQERIVELYAEGQRGFDLRRWRKLEQVWGGIGGAGVWRIDTYGANQTRYYQNATDRDFQRAYIFRIPPSERDRNPNLTQNIPWR